jgi:anti-sigma factor RsiW
MKCNWVQHRLVAYLDTELPAPGRLKVETHLSACGICREALQRFESTRPGPGTPQTHPPEYWAPMHNAVLRELQTKPDKAPTRRNAWTVAYALLFFLVIGWSLFQAVLPGGSP